MVIISISLKQDTLPLTNLDRSVTGPAIRKYQYIHSAEMSIY